MRNNYQNKKLYKELLVALIFSLIIAIIINSYSTYTAFKEYDKDYELSLKFFNGIIENMVIHIYSIFNIFMNFPFLLPLPVLYVFIFVKALKSNKVMFEKNRTLFLTILLVLFFVFTYRFVGFVASIY